MDGLSAVSTTIGEVGARLNHCRSRHSAPESRDGVTHEDKKNDVIRCPEVAVFTIPNEVSRSRLQRLVGNHFNRSIMSQIYSELLTASFHLPCDTCLEWRTSLGRCLSVGTCIGPATGVGSRPRWNAIQNGLPVWGV